MTEWIEYKLEDIAEVTMGQSPKSEFYNTEGKGRPFLQGNRTFGRRFPTFDTWTTKMTKEAKAGDVIMSVRAPVGDLNITPTDMCLGRGVCGIRMKNGKQNFLYYLMKYSIPQLLNMETGTIFGSVNRNDINGLRVLVPDEETQDKVTAYLKNIDDKIETNEAINRNLQEQAFTIFKEMFPNVNQGEHMLGEHLSPVKGKALLSKDAIEGDVPVIAGGLSPATYHNIANTKAPVLTISASGANAGYVALWHAPVWSSDSSYIDSNMTDNVYFWYAMLKTRQKEIFDAQTGSAQPHIYPKNIDVLPVAELERKKVADYTTQVSSMFELMGKNIQENERLSALRDGLLPKLMSGELDVSDLNI